VKLCTECSASFTSQEWLCPVCGNVPACREGFRSFADPQGGEGFHPDFFAGLAAVEQNNFWFLARNRLIGDFVHRCFPQAGTLLEVGCGTGFVLSGLAARFPSIKLTGSEYFVQGLPFAQQRVPQATLIQADARKLPFVDEFDLIGAFDVLEHIDEDEDALASIFRAVRPGGGVLITVPQHSWLWSSADDAACHVRRYSRRELVDKLAAAGFAVEEVTSFVTLLLPAMILSRLFKRNSPKGDPLAELKLPPFLNKFFAVLMAFERRLTNLGVCFPCGGSLLVVGTKAEIVINGDE
jgi:SAM-dependent methyltransferase